MNLNNNSFSARVYRWFYNQDVMPQNLCPYFWMLVTAYIFTLPLVIFTLPFELVIGKFGKDNASIGTRIGVSMFMWFAIFVVFLLLSPILLLFGATFNGSLGGFFSGAIMGYVALILIGIGVLIKFIIEKIKKRVENKYDEDGKVIHRGRTKKPNIIVEFIKAKYNKYCPKITWNNE